MWAPPMPAVCGFSKLKKLKFLFIISYSPAFVRKMEVQIKYTASFYYSGWVCAIFKVSNRFLNNQRTLVSDLVFLCTKNINLPHDLWRNCHTNLERGVFIDEKNGKEYFYRAYNRICKRAFRIRRRHDCGTLPTAYFEGGNT